MNTEFLTNGDDDEVQPPSFTITMNASQLDAFNKAIEEELKNRYNITSFQESDKPKSNKEYSDKMKDYLEERNKK